MSIAAAIALGLGSAVSATYLGVVALRSGLEVVGDLVIASAVLRLTAPLVRLGLDQWAAEFASNTAHHRRQILRVALAATLLGTALLVVGASVWGMLTLSRLPLFFMACAVALPAINFSYLIGQFLIVGGSPLKATLLQSVLAPTISLGILVPFGHVSPLGAATGFSAGWILTGILALFLAPDRRRRPFTDASHLSASTAIRQSFPYLQAGVLVYAIAELPVLLTGPFLDREEIAYVGLALRMFALFGLLSGGVVIARTAQLLSAAGDGQARILAQMRSHYLYLGVPVAGIIILGAPRVFEVLGVSADSIDREALLVATLLGLVSGWLAPAVAVLRARGQRLMIRSAYLVGVVAMLILLPIFALGFGAQGAIVGAVGANLSANGWAARAMARDVRPGGAVDPC